MIGQTFRTREPGIGAVLNVVSTDAIAIAIQVGGKTVSFGCLRNLESDVVRTNDRLRSHLMQPGGQVSNGSGRAHVIHGCKQLWYGEPTQGAQKSEREQYFDERIPVAAVAGCAFEDGRLGVAGIEPSLTSLLHCCGFGRSAFGAPTLI
jgi:hypothetical protein